MNYVEAIGLLAGFLGLVAWVPQIQRIWIQKRADGISLPTFSEEVLKLTVINVRDCTQYYSHYTYFTVI